MCIPNEHHRLNDLADCIREFRANVDLFTPSASRLTSPGTVPCLKTILSGGEAVIERDKARIVARETGARPRL